jgi:hypothetical protein
MASGRAMVRTGGVRLPTAVADIRGNSMVFESGDAIASGLRTTGAGTIEAGVDQDWYYIGAGDHFCRRIESSAHSPARINHIVLWGGQACDVGPAEADGDELHPTRHPLTVDAPGIRLGVEAADGVSIAYGPGVEPATATITFGTASVEFDPRTVADIILWNGKTVHGDERQKLFIWNANARHGAGAFVLAGRR